MSAETHYHQIEYSPEPVDELQVRIGEHEITLNRYNMALRLFETGEGRYDHVVYLTDDGKRIAFRADSRLQEALLGNFFPHTCDVEPDEMTQAWYNSLPQPPACS